MNKKNLPIILLILIIIVGCSIANTPIAQVESLLSNYQKVDKNLNINYNELSNDIDISNELKNKYIDLIEDQYSGLSYEIKEEVIDGDTAIVTTSIEVMNYKEIINKYNKNEYTTEEYHELIINDLNETKTKVTYTIDFRLTKDNNGDWKVDNLTNETREKLLGIN